MALLRKLNFNFVKPTTNIFRSTVISNYGSRKPKDILEEVKEKSKADLPIKIENPFNEEKPKCLLCKLGIEPDFKNVRLLSQFVSRHTGRIYDRSITGLCREKQGKIVSAIQKAQAAGLMAVMMKNPDYFEDPQLFDPWRPVKKTI